MPDEVEHLEESLPSTEEQDEKVSDSSPEDGEKKGPASAFEAAMAALNKDKAQDEATPASEGEESETEETDTEAKESGEEETDERTEEEKDKDLPFHKHPRWQEVYKERNELRDKLASMEDYAPSKQKAQSWDGLQDFVAKSGLSDQDMDAGFEIMVAMKHDPARAYGMLKPYMEALSQMVGETLPEDLQGLVETGRMDEEAAKQYARERSSRQWHEAKRGEERQAYQGQQVQQSRAAETARVQAITQAVQAWESDWSKSDADFSKKHALVHDRTVAIVRAEGAPATPDDAIAIAKRARSDVEKQLGGLLPKKDPKTFVSGGAASRSSTTPQPKSALEAAKMALSQR